MKTYIWHMVPTFPSKVNFIDSNNVLLGYDLHQCCCENAFWNFIDSNNVLLGYGLHQCCCENAFWTVSESLDGSNPLHQGDNSSDNPQEISLEHYVFDPDFYQLHEDEGREEYVAIFRLVGLPRWRNGARVSERPDLYVRLVNHHNGYYSHGFTFSGHNAIKGIL